MNVEMTFSHDKEFHDIVNNKETLRRSTEKLLYNIIAEITLGIILDTHRKSKSRAIDLDGTISNGHEEELSSVDIFEQQNMKKTQECDCPNCSKTVAATRFAPHLAQCMGMGRNRSSRRIASNNDNNIKDRDSSSYSVLSEDEDDVYWSSRRKKKQRNGNKKGKGSTPKKSSHRESESVESLNVDIEGDDEVDVSLRDFLQDSSNQSSPSDSITGNSNSKRKEKGKNKKSNKRDRASPNTCLTD